MQINSSSFTPGGPIPRVHTCQGQDLSPALSWERVPAGTRSLVLVVEDPDAPDPAHPKRTWVHWVLYNLPASAGGLPAGVAQAALPPGALQGRNDWKTVGYRGPCPPIGRHRYFHRLFALDVELPDLGEPTKSGVEQAMAGHVLATAEIVGTYQKE